MESKGHTLVVVAILVLAALLAWLVWRMSQAKKAASSSLGGAGQVAATVAGKSGAVLNDVPYVGGLISSTINSPVTNVTSGNVKSTALSAATGGLSDVFGW
jgi:hypothetical protein